MSGAAAAAAAAAAGATTESVILKGQESQKMFQDATFC